MKLLYKLLIGYLVIIIVIGSISSVVLIYGIKKNSQNLSVYREREITSFVYVIDAIINDEKSLEDLDRIEKMFFSIAKKLPHVKRLTLHRRDKKTGQYWHVLSTVEGIKGTPSDPEDIDAFLQKKTTILYETDTSGQRYIDVTYPITDEEGHVIAAMGVLVSLTESDAVLQKAITAMEEEAVTSILVSILLSIFIATLFVFTMTRKIIAPLEKLKTAVKSISNHEGYEMIEQVSDDEIGELAEEFNKMAQELNRLYTSMQEQIDAKTQEIENNFLTDDLMEIPNREALFRAFEKRPDFYLAILDVASFKDINDVYGVQLGNKVLKKLSQSYSRLIEGSGMELYRISGDEVVLFDPLRASKEAFITMVSEIITNIDHQTFYLMEEDTEIHLSLHAGISFESDHAMEKANIALIKAKREHLDYVVYDETFQESGQVESLDMIRKIKNAVSNYDFVAYYQPIVDRELKVIKYEALVRMRDGNKVISPFEFLDVAKKTKYYASITRTMVAQAFKDFQESEVYISVNLSADDITNLETQQFIQRQLKSFKHPEHVVFELVESEDLYALKGLKEFITAIRAVGAKIAIDDFGTGYSNFSYLLELEPDYIKIDGSLIRYIDSDQKSYDIVKMIVNMAHASDITVTAEFVHSQEVLDICRELEVDEFQGYLFGAPSENIEVR